jgi:hypothetical protein
MTESIGGGKHGDWTAIYEGEVYPVVHIDNAVNTWPHYVEHALHVPVSARWRAHIEMIKQKQMVIFQNGEEDWKGTLHRIGYVGNSPFHVSDVEFNERTLRFVIGPPVVRKRERRTKHA